MKPPTPCLVDQRLSPSGKKIFCQFLVVGCCSVVSIFSVQIRTEVFAQEQQAPAAITPSPVSEPEIRAEVQNQTLAPDIRESLPSIESVKLKVSEIKQNLISPTIPHSSLPVQEIPIPISPLPRELENLSQQHPSPTPDSSSAIPILDASKSPDSQQLTVSVNESNLATGSGSLIFTVDCSTCQLVATVSVTTMEASVSASSQPDPTDPGQQAASAESSAGEEPTVSGHDSGQEQPAAVEEPMLVVDQPVISRITGLKTPSQGPDGRHKPENQMPISSSGATPLPQPAGSDHLQGFNSLATAWLGMAQKIYLPGIVGNSYLVSYWITGLFLISMERFVRLKSGRSPTDALLTI